MNTLPLGAVSDDRWTCPVCQRTVVVTATAEDTRWCLRAAQERHARRHATAGGQQ